MHCVQALLIIAGLIGYFIGSIPSGVIFSRLFGNGDIRALGSGSTGATNVFRTQGKFVAALTLLADIAKGILGYLAVLALAPLQADRSVIAMFQVIGIISPVLGHIYPVWLKFNGGKGVATALGVTVAFCPLLSVICAVIWVCTLLLFKISSVAGMVTCILAIPIASIILKGQGSSCYCPEGACFYAYLFIVVLIFYRHKDNIVRLFRGEEKRIITKKK